jgi:mitochondrial translocator assembly and maintenance protein 41
MTNTALREIVARPAITQSIKGIFTAGGLKSFKYAGQKLKKSFKARN